MKIKQLRNPIFAFDNLIVARQLQAWFKVRQAWNLILQLSLSMKRAIATRRAPTRPIRIRSPRMLLSSSIASASSRGNKSDLFVILLHIGLGAILGVVICILIAWLTPNGSGIVRAFGHEVQKFLVGARSLAPSVSSIRLKQAVAESSKHVELQSSTIANKNQNLDETHESGTASTAGGRGPWSNELEARSVMERLLGVPFPKVRPAWLLNPTTGRCLELDLFAESLSLAVEVDGVQHAVWPNPFHATKELFDQQQLRDALKDTLCKLQNVTLIRIPHTVKRKHIETYLCQKLAEHSIPSKRERNGVQD